MTTRLTSAAYKSTDGLVWEQVRGRWVALYRGLLNPSVVAARERAV